MNSSSLYKDKNYVSSRKGCLCLCPQYKRPIGSFVLASSYHKGIIISISEIKPRKYLKDSMNSFSIQLQSIAKQTGLWSVLRDLWALQIDLNLFVREMTVLAKALGQLNPGSIGSMGVADYISRTLTNMILAVISPYVHMAASPVHHLLCNANSIEKVDIRLRAHFLNAYYAHLQMKGGRTIRERSTSSVAACNLVVEKLADNEGSAKSVDCMALVPIGFKFNGEDRSENPEEWLILQRKLRLKCHKKILRIVESYAHCSPSIAAVEHRLLRIKELRGNGCPVLAATLKRSLYRKLEKVLNRLARNIESHEDMVKAEVCLEILEALFERGGYFEIVRDLLELLAETLKSYKRANAPHQPPAPSLKPLKSSVRRYKVDIPKEKKKVRVALPNPDPSIKEYAIYETKNPSILRRMARRVKLFGKKLGSSSRCIAKRVNDAVRGILGASSKDSVNSEPKPKRREHIWGKLFRSHKIH